jgi:hypothetical protein
MTEKKMNQTPVSATDLSAMNNIQLINYLVFQNIRIKAAIEKNFCSNMLSLAESFAERAEAALKERNVTVHPALKYTYLNPLVN